MIRFYVVGSLIFGLNLSFASGQMVDSLAGQAMTDNELKALAAESGYEFFKKSTQWLPFTEGGGGHDGFIRIRFNETASAVLDSQGYLPKGLSFPTGSVVVKEIREKVTDRSTGLAIMVKAPDAPNANQGWVWGEYGQDGQLIYSASKGGRACIRCHSIGSGNSPVAGDRGHSDFVRTFGLR